MKDFEKEFGRRLKEILEEKLRVVFEVSDALKSSGKNCARKNYSIYTIHLYAVEIA